MNEEQTLEDKMWDIWNTTEDIQQCIIFIDSLSVEDQSTLMTMLSKKYMIIQQLMFGGGR